MTKKLAYEVIDNFLDKEYFDTLKTALTSDDISWFYRDNLTSNNDESGMFYFTHNFFYKNTISSPFFNLLEPLFTRLNISSLLGYFKYT